MPSENDPCDHFKLFRIWLKSYGDCRLEIHKKHWFTTNRVCKYKEGTYMLCSTHQPQWGSPELRHSPHVPYCSHDSIGTRVTCRTKKTRFWKKEQMKYIQSIQAPLINLMDIWYWSNIWSQTILFWDYDGHGEKSAEGKRKIQTNVKSRKPSPWTFCWSDVALSYLRRLTRGLSYVIMYQHHLKMFLL